MTDTITGWHFSADTLRDGSPRPARGVTLRHEGEVIPCKSGYHMSERAIDALYHAPGSWVARVSGTGAVPHGNPVDKYACRTRTTLTDYVDAAPVLRRLAAVWAHRALQRAAKALRATGVAELVAHAETLEEIKPWANAAHAAHDAASDAARAASAARAANAASDAARAASAARAANAAIAANAACNAANAACNAANAACNAACNAALAVRDAPCDAASAARDAAIDSASAANVAYEASAERDRQNKELEAALNELLANTQPNESHHVR